MGSNPSSAEGLKAGIQRMEEQHREMKARFDAFFQACQEGGGAAQVESLLEFAESYTQSHMGFEEALMAQAGFPSAQAHKREHDAIKSELAQLRGQIGREGSTPEVVGRARDVLSSWVARHIGELDRELEAYLEATSEEPGSKLY